jgi:hypothetical protein
MARTSVWTRSATICVVLFLGSCGKVSETATEATPPLEPVLLEAQAEQPRVEVAPEPVMEAMQAEPEAEAAVDMAEADILEPVEVQPDAGEPAAAVAEEVTPVAPKAEKSVTVKAAADPRAVSRKTVMVQEAEAVYVQSEQVQRSKEALIEQREQVADLQIEVWDYRLHRLERHAKRKGWSCDKDPGPIKEWERRFWTEWCELKPKVEAVRGPVDTHTHDWELEPDGR